MGGGDSTHWVYAGFPGSREDPSHQIYGERTMAMGRGGWGMEGGVVKMVRNRREDEWDQK